MGERNPLLPYLKRAGIDLVKIPCSSDDYDEICILEYENDDFVDVTAEFYEYAAEYKEEIASHEIDEFYTLKPLSTIIK